MTAFLVKAIIPHMSLQVICESAHLVPHHHCKRLKLDSLDKSDNNRLALSRQMHGYLDGLCNGRRPIIRLNYISSSDTSQDGRYSVVLEIQCYDVGVSKVVEPLLKEGTRKTSELTFDCTVWVRDKIEFIENVNFKSNETMKIWSFSFAISPLNHSFYLNLLINFSELESYQIECVSRDAVGTS